MALALPPKSVIRCDAQTAKQVAAQLTSVIAGHPQATTTYRFYEELDAWLGPWGAQGYPIAYGKFYNVAFTTNEKLMADVTAREWVRRTTVLLQEALRDYVVGRILDCTLPSLTEAQLRKAAFDSHPAAYDKGGLAMLVLAAPELLPVVATIPGREFLPSSGNVGATINQVVVTIGRIAPQLVGGSIAAMAGPAHTGVMQRAFQMDRQRMISEQAIIRELGNIKGQITRGEVDHIPALDEIIDRLNAREYPHKAFALSAREVIQLAQTRRQMLVRRNQELLQQSPAVRTQVERSYPKYLR